jgi:hypothetical protein
VTESKEEELQIGKIASSVKESSRREQDGNLRFDRNRSY